MCLDATPRSVGRCTQLRKASKRTALPQKKNTSEKNHRNTFEASPCETLHIIFAISSRSSTLLGTTNRWVAGRNGLVCIFYSTEHSSEVIPCSILLFAEIIFKKCPRTCFLAIAQDISYFRGGRQASRIPVVQPAFQ